MNSTPSIATSRRSSSAFVVTAAVLSFVLLVAIWLVQYWSYRNDAAARELLRHTQEFLGQNAEMRARLSEAGMAMRGYMLTGNDRFLKIMATATNDFETILNSTRGLVRYDTAETTHFTRLESEARMYLRLISESLSHPPSDRPAPVASPKTQLEVTQERVAMRETFNEIARDEERVLVQRNSEAQRRDRLAQGAVLGGGIVALLLIAVALMALVRENRARYRAESALKEANGELERRVDQRTAALRDQKARLEATVQTAGEGIITINADGVVESINPAAERMFAYHANEIVGCNVKTLMPLAYQAQHDEAFGDWVLAGRAQDLGAGREVEGQRKDGARFPMDLSVSEFTLAGQRRFVGLIRDITVRRQADEMRNRLAAIVESAEDAIMSNDLNGTISSWNAGAQRVFGYSAEEAIGQPINMLIPAELQDEEPEILEKVKRGERIDRYETVRLHKSGARVNISLIISPLRDSRGNVIGASKIARDITERIRLEVAVAAAMEEERGRIARDLHDGVGQQLGGALFLSDLVQRDLKERGATEGARAAEVYGLVTKALAQVREVSRGLYPVSPEPDGLMAALQNLADRVARDRGMDCTFDADSAVLLSDGALATHLYRIAQEAVNNSLNHSGSKRIEIQLAKTARFLTLSIRDYGTGLHKGTYQGGLGVRTMRDRARLMGGQIKFHNRQDDEGGGLEVVCFVRKGWAISQAGWGEVIDKEPV